MMLRVIASWNGVDVVQLVAVKAPVANEFFRQLLVILLHFWQRRIENCEITEHAGRFAIFAQHKPVRMFLHYLRHDVFVRLPLTMAILYYQRIPPKLGVDAFFMKVICHLLNGIAGEGFRTWIPVAVGGEPAIV